MDVSRAKLDLLRQNLSRSGLDNIEVALADGRVFQEKYENLADLLIADLPCSGLGMIGKKADIKYRITPQRIEELLRLQREILSNVIRYLKPGGILMYSTCTLNPAENEETVAWILDHLPVESLSIEEDLPNSLKGTTGSKGYLTLLPGVQKSEGFFIAKFRKIGTKNNA